VRGIDSGSPGQLVKRPPVRQALLPDLPAEVACHSIFFAASHKKIMPHS
jgi:hypothetical protein